MHKQLVLLHNAVAAYFSGRFFLNTLKSKILFNESLINCSSLAGNASALEGTLKQFNIKVRDINVSIICTKIILNFN